MLPDWFYKAKLGIFIHWGMYAVHSTGESWEFALGAMSYDEYMTQLPGFTASKYDPEHWAELFKKAGATYAVLTTKHHDGLALWDTKFGKMSTVRSTPAGRDLVAPYCEALRKNGLKVGLYFTHTDWSSDEHMAVVCDKPIEEIREMRHRAINLVNLWKPVLADKIPHVNETQTKQWETFLELYYGQISELIENYSPIDLFWGDGMFERAGYDWNKPKVRAMIKAANPDTIISRLPEYSDVKTPEVRMPARPVSAEPWEYCTMINEHWGYCKYDDNYKTPNTIVRIFCDTIAMGGNLLLDVGPMEDGTIDPRQEDALLWLGKFIDKNKEAIYDTHRGLDWCFYNGGSVASEDGTTLYLFVHGIPCDGVMVKGVDTKIKKASVLTTGKELRTQWFFRGGYASFFIHLAPEDCDPETTTVIKLEFVEKYKADDDWGMLWEMENEKARKE